MSDPGVLYRIPDSGPPISRGRFALYLWLVCETMVFVGLLGAFVVTRFSNARMWPPSYEGPHNTIVTPPLVGLAAPVANAIVLGLLMAVIVSARRPARQGDVLGTQKRLMVVTTLGITFLAIMAYEFVHEASRGLTLTSGQYGAYIVVISAVHGLHVLAGVIWQFLSGGARLRMPLGGVDVERVEQLCVYWGFVAVAWAVLLLLLYIL